MNTMRPYIFGKNKVYPLPVTGPCEGPLSVGLCPTVTKAPWSGPRGYSTSIPEEVAAYKASLPVRRPKPIETVKTVKIKQLKSDNHIFNRFWERICDHFIAIRHNMFPRQSVLRPNGDIEMPRLIAILCCIRAEVD